MGYFFFLRFFFAPGVYGPPGGFLVLMRLGFLPFFGFAIGFFFFVAMFLFSVHNPPHRDEDRDG